MGSFLLTLVARRSTMGRNHKFQREERIYSGESSRYEEPGDSRSGRMPERWIACYGNGRQKNVEIETPANSVLRSEGRSRRVRSLPLFVEENATVVLSGKIGLLSRTEN